MNDNGLTSGDTYYKANTLATLNLAQAAAGSGVKRFIFLSTAKVNGEASGLGNPFREEDAVNPQDFYSFSKYQAEEGLLTIASRTNMEAVIVRPPLVYGPGVKANFAAMLNALQSNRLLPLGLINNKRSLLYLGNLTDLIVHCINHPQAANQVFFASDGCDVSTTELLISCAAALSVKTRVLPVPTAVLVTGAKLLGKGEVAQRLCGSFQVDINKSWRYLGWKPPVAMVDGLKVTAESFQKD